MIQAQAKFRNTKDVIVDIQLSMTVEECEQFIKNIEKNTTWPNFDIIQAIKNSVLRKLTDVGYGESSTQTPTP